MTEPVTLEKIKLVGFRAYLKPANFRLHRRSTPISMAVFAPNGMGKSSLVDSLEYYFSEDGTLDRLGRRSSPTQAGPSALRHVDAEDAGTSVHMWFRQGRKKFDDSRPVPAPFPPAAESVLGMVKVPFVIRGYELRRFVDDTSPVDRYRELAEWFELEPLLAVQENLKALRNRVGRMVADTTDTRERLRDLTGATDGAIREFDEAAVLDWLNDIALAPLNGSIRFTELSADDPALRELEGRRRAERERTGLETLENLLAAIDALLGRPATGPEGQGGHIDSFEKSVSRFKDAVANEAAMRSATSESVFGEVWAKAKDLLESGAELDECPVCDTKFAKSPNGSREGVYASLSRSLENLEEYRKAEVAKDSAEAKLRQATRSLGEALDRFSLLAGSAYQYDTVAAYRGALRSCNTGEPAPDSGEAAGALNGLRASISADVERIRQQQSEFTYDAALKTTRRLLATKSELERIRRTKEELRAIRECLGRQAGAFGAAIAEHTGILIGSLQDEIRSIYEHIQGAHAKVPLIRIELAGEGSYDQRSAQVLIDFADSCKGAMPGGFLSDSQIHTLALSIRLAAIHRFNAGARILALDDIVTSYDADHRKNIATMLNKYFGDFQIILATHDRHFFDILPDHFPKNRWRFAKIKELQSGVGPVLEDHLVRDEEVEMKLNKRQDAINDIRKVQEEWLDRICREFETPTTFRRDSNHSLNELATSLGLFLKNCNLGSPTLPEHSRPFLESMQRSKIENLGSHHRNDPYTSSSDGDTRARWEEFKIFRSMFKCPKCGHQRFKRPPDFTIPVCAKCKTPFSFGCQTQ